MRADIRPSENADALSHPVQKTGNLSDMMASIIFGKAVLFYPSICHSLRYRETNTKVGQVSIKAAKYSKMYIDVYYWLLGPTICH